MSALNIIQETDSVHLVTDGAQYALDGTVIGFRSKIAVLPRSQSIVAMRGRVPHVFPLLGMDQLDDFDLLASRLGDYLRGTFQALRIVDPGSFADPSRKPLTQMEIVAAGWSAARDQPEVWGATTDPEEVGLFSGVPDVEPLQSVALPILATSPGISLSALFGTIESMVDIDRFDVGETAIAMLQAQRQQPFRVGAVDMFVVGGFGELGSVTRSGARVRRLLTWPDEVGQPIAG